jgi:hypothetical protein
MADFYFELRGIHELQAAVRRSPDRVVTEVGKFLVRGIAAYNRVIIRNPWRRGMSGGGAPVKTGNLRDTHRREVRKWDARIYPTAPYAPYVHGIKGLARRRSYQLRPWLDFAKDAADKEVQGYERDMLKAIVDDLAS